MLDVADVNVFGNYIGTNPAGTVAKANEGGVTHRTIVSVHYGVGTNIGSLNAADRNLISGNHDFALAPDNDWTVLGNYMGLAADGVTALGNSHADGSGAITVDDCDGVVIGGTATGSANVISANYMYGISPVSATNMVIQGNLIGTDYTGTIARGNGFTGVLIGGGSTNMQLGGTSAAARNIISANGTAGVLIGDTSGGVIEGNYIGLDSSGAKPLPNGKFGVMMSSTASTLLGGASAGARNVVSANTLANVIVAGSMATTTGAVVQGNYIGTNAAGAVDTDITAANGGGVLIYGNAVGNLIGGTEVGQGNRIAGNRGYGVGVGNITIDIIPMTIPAYGNTFIGNSIYDTTPNSDLSDTVEAIDLLQTNITGDPQPPYLPDAFSDMGLNENDPSGSVPGQSNDYLNHPVITAANGTSSTLTVTYDVVAAGASTGQYRVEFYGNDTAGSGQAKTFLGYADVAPGTGLTTNLIAPSSYNFSGKYITASITQIDDDEVNNGFGSTSEFSPSVAANVVATPSILPEVGAGVGLKALILGSMFAMAVVWHQRRLKNSL